MGTKMRKAKLSQAFCSGHVKGYTTNGDLGTYRVCSTFRFEVIVYQLEAESLYPGGVCDRYNYSVCMYVSNSNISRICIGSQCLGLFSHKRWLLVDATRFHCCYKVWQSSCCCHKRLDRSLYDIIERNPTCVTTVRYKAAGGRVPFIRCTSLTRVYEAARPRVKIEQRGELLALRLIVGPRPFCRN